MKRSNCAKGFLLLHLVLIMVVLAAIGFGTLYLTGIGNQWSKSVQGQFEVRALHLEIAGFLSDVRHCTASLGATMVPNAVGSFTLPLRDASTGANVYPVVPGQAQGDFLTMGVGNLGMNVPNNILGLASIVPFFPLTMNYGRIGSVMGSSRLGRGLNISFNQNGANIGACAAEPEAAAGNQGFILGNENGFWQMIGRDAVSVPDIVLNGLNVVMQPPNFTAIGGTPGATADALLVRGNMLSRGSATVAGGVQVTGMTSIAGDNAINVAGLQVSLSVGGQVVAGAYNMVSDRRLKRDIMYLSDLLAKVSKIQGVSYKLRNSASDRKHFGFVAQDIERIVPEAVTMDPETGTRLLNYDTLIPVVIGSIQELHEEISRQEEGLAALEIEILTMYSNFCNQYPDDHLCLESSRSVLF